MTNVDRGSRKNKGKTEQCCYHIDLFNATKILAGFCFEVDIGTFAEYKTILNQYM